MKTLINKIEKATKLISDIADYYERNNLKMSNENRKDLSVVFNNLAEIYDCLSEVVSTNYKSDTEVI